MYAKGMTTGDIEAHIQDIYGIELSDTTISRITDKILPIAKEWQQRPPGGVEDIFIACTDNLTGFSAAIGAVFPKTEIQNCIIHQLRNSSKYVTPFLNPKTKATVLF